MQINFNKERGNMDKYMSANIVFSLFAKDYMELKKELPIRPSEMAVLNIITQRDGKYTPLMIAELLDVSKPMIAAHIQALLKKGYICKERSVSDKRSFYVLPTEKAVKLTDEFNEKHTQYLKSVEKTLGENDFDELIRLIDKVLPMLKSEKEKREVEYAEQ